ncbi:hypothetical protein QYE76_032394 [Lolium multiflorum]|uniref:Uncharacterized protein n=1 Tax=Lolium multiflorum TaxID=4521 RepID=A0AAD8VKJ6_LOLMU|nr:hypothetical protein QYE76_032394 [Lolium multiflorum]
MVEQARMDLVAKSDILNKPITPEEAADPEALEAKRQEMLATAQKFAKTAAAMLEERTIAANFVDHFQKKDREVDESLEKVRQLEKLWEAKQPLATPKDNMKKAAELLKKKDEEIDINYVRKLVASAMQQQSKADTSRRLASNPEHCISTAQKDATAGQHRDGESRTGSTEREESRDHPNPIPVSSDSTPKNPLKGKDPMYTGRDKYRVPSPPPRASRPPLPLDVAVPGNTRPHGPVESISATTCRLLETGAGAYAETTRSRNQDREPSLVGIKNTTLSLAEAKDAIRNQGGAERRVRTRATRSRNDGGDHHQDLPRHHQVEAEVEAEVGPEIPFPLEITRRCPRDARDRLNEYDPTTSVQERPGGRIQASPEAPPRGKGGKGKNKDKEEDSSEAMDEDDASPEPKEGTAANKSNPFGKKSVGTYHTFLGTPTTREKIGARILNAMFRCAAVCQVVGESCTFDRSDHPAVIPKECYALVVSPRIDGYDFSKCLMDGGASLNIMYLETIDGV